MQLTISQLPVPLELGHAGSSVLRVRVQRLDIHLQEFRLRLVAQHFHQRRVDGEQSVVRRTLVDAVYHVIEQLAKLRFGAEEGLHGPFPLGDIDQDAANSGYLPALVLDQVLVDFNGKRFAVFAKKSPVHRRELVGRGQASDNGRAAVFTLFGRDQLPNVFSDQLGSVVAEHDASGAIDAAESSRVIDFAVRNRSVLKQHAEALLALE